MSDCKRFSPCLVSETGSCSPVVKLITSCRRDLQSVTSASSLDTLQSARDVALSYEAASHCTLTWRLKVNIVKLAVVSSSLLLLALLVLACRLTVTPESRKVYQNVEKIKDIIKYFTNELTGAIATLSNRSSRMLLEAVSDD